MGERQVRAEIGTGRSAPRSLVYRLWMGDYVKAGLIVVAVGLAVYGWPRGEARWGTETALILGLGYLCFTAYRTHSVLLRLRRLEDIYWLLSCAYSDGIPLDDTFKWIVQEEAHGRLNEQLLRPAPSDAPIRSILQAMRSRFPVVTLRDEEGEELPALRPHVLYRNAKRRVLRRFRSVEGEYIALFRVRGEAD